jgi:hypothetical protein
MARNGTGASQETGESRNTISSLLATRLAGAVSALGLRDDEAEAILADAGDRGSALARAAGEGQAAARLAETAAIAHVLARLAEAGRLGRQRVD